MTLFTRAKAKAAQESKVWAVFAAIFQFQFICRGVDVLAILIILYSDSRSSARVTLLYGDKMQSFIVKIKKIPELTRSELNGFIPRVRQPTRGMLQIKRKLKNRPRKLRPVRRCSFSALTLITSRSFIMLNFIYARKASQIQVGKLCKI